MAEPYLRHLLNVGCLIIDSNARLQHLLPQRLVQGHELLLQHTAHFCRVAFHAEAGVARPARTSQACMMYPNFMTFTNLLV